MGATGERALVGLGLALLVGGATAVMFAAHRDGHWWGDDWALYVRQAESLIHADPGRVAAENRFTIDGSLGPPFSPPLYPWGFPTILVPFVAALGTDPGGLSIVPVLSAAVCAVCWFVLVRRRLGLVAAYAAVVAIPLTPLLLGWTELIQSEWPFLAVTAVVLVGLDGLVRSGRLLGPSARVVPLVALGLGVAAGFSVRREGLGLAAAVAAAQLGAVTTVAGRAWLGERRRTAALQLAGPHAVALAIVGAVQVALPSTLVPRYDGTSIANVWRYADRHVEHLAEVAGLWRPWDRDPVVLGSVPLGELVIALFVVGSVAGLVVALRRRADVHLAAFAIVAFLVGASFRTAINRYVCAVAPVLLLLALTALRAALEHLDQGRDGRFRRLARVMPAAVLTSIAAGNLANAHVQIDEATTWADAGRVEWGPDHPDAIEMFDAVRTLTDPDDVVGAPKARAMVLETGRRTVQVDDVRPVPFDPTPAFVVAENGSTSYRRLTDGPPLRAGDYEPVWSNPRFTIFERIEGS